MPVSPRLPRRIVAATLFLLIAKIASAEDRSAAPGSDGTREGAVKGEVVTELNPYYSSVGYNIPLTDKPIPTIAAESEQAVYGELIQGSLVPRYMLLEASVYPLPWLFTYIKSDMPNVYRDGEIGHSGVNLFESATAGFQEPWAVSMFLGNVAKLKGPNDRQDATNWGYTGYLVSVGNKHIKENSLIDDDWCEVEWKIKGRRDDPVEKLDWSFRGGAKFNSNHDVGDVYYVGLHRSDIDFGSSFLEWLRNTNFDVRLHALQSGGEIVRVEVIGGKNLPIKKWHAFSTVDIGFVWTSPDEYAGQLRDRRTNKMTLVLRPGFGF